MSNLRRSFFLIIITFSIVVYGQSNKIQGISNVHADNTRCSHFIMAFCEEFNKNAIPWVITDVKSACDSLELAGINYRYSEITIAGIQFTKDEIGCVFTEIKETGKPQPFLLYLMEKDEKFTKLYILQGSNISGTCGMQGEFNLR